MTIEIRPISAQQTHPLRLRILRNNNPEANLNYPGDDAPNSLHVGAFDDDALVGIASIYNQAMATRPDQRGWRLRGMATADSHRRQGLGKRLLQACFEHICQQQGDLFWCNARTSARAFYEAMGFQIEGDEFISPGIGPHFVMWRSMVDVKIPTHEGCFICDPNLPTGLGIQWYGRADGVSIHSTVTLSQSHQGPPQHAHGGVSAAILDDAMGTCAWYAGHMVMTAKMTVNYRRPVPLGVQLTARARVTGVEGRKVFMKGELCLPSGDVAVETDGLFVVMREMFENTVLFEDRIAFAQQIASGSDQTEPD